MKSLIIQTVYYISAVLFIVGLKRMSSPKTATTGIHWAAVGIFSSVLVTFLFPHLQNLELIILAIIIGSIIAWYLAGKIGMTSIPEMIALFNGMGGAAAAGISAVELLRLISDPKIVIGIKIGIGIGIEVEREMPILNFVLAVIGALIGSISFSGSLLAFMKLRDLLKKTIHFPLQQWINFLFLLVAVLAAIAFYYHHSLGLFIVFFLASLIYGILITIPIGGADMPVLIALYNALTGMAVAAEGFLLNNVAMVIAGTVVSSSGFLLTRLMAKAMNRSLSSLLFTKFTETSGQSLSENIRSMDASDAAIILNYISKVIFVPGYGMAVAQAQQKVWELASILLERGIDVRFAIHPVAGRMPGHMNVLLAEAGVPYDYIFAMEDINNDFSNTDVVIVIGANDVVNPSARTDKSSAIYGMPILNVDMGKQIFVIKRGKGLGYAGVENTLFYNQKTSMIYGDAKNVVSKMIQTLRSNL
ncbi:MAG: NAD(P)(+) transhydrogenase (Re/Si-specific) subunit beta [Oligoflexia bacterium]|nr:NAD(P)(+) transhydrogenase (Re/Si-specific) subunit beta [Oligoflexia bacterium]